MQQDEAAWDSQEVRGHRVRQPRDERRAAQKRTFTRWMNVFLQRRDPPVEVHDLFTDIQDGKVLMALLEELSGCKLLYRFRSSPHRIFRLNNISKALAFLDDRHVKLLGIDAPGIADGVPSVVLNLLWNIISHFQVREVTGGLQKHLSSSLSSLSMSSYSSSDELSPQPGDAGGYSCRTLPGKGRKAAREPKYHGKAIKTLLRWVQRCTTKFGVEVQDFGRSWRSGLAFLALIKSTNPALVDLRDHLSTEPLENLRQAFTIAQRSLDVPPLLEPEDVACISPDEQSIITYVSTFLEHYSGVDEDLMTDIDPDIPEIPNFGSLESVGFGETLADDPAAQHLLRRLEKSHEQELWRRWARRSSGGSCSGTSRHCPGVAEKPAGNPQAKKGRRVPQPPSPLDAAVASQEIQRWLERGCGEQGHGKPGGGQGHLSLSSEEGIYSLTALDSDEEDAFSYILDLNKEVFQPGNQLKRQVPRVEEETAEEMMLNQRDSQHPEVSEMLNGGACKHQEGSPERSVHSDGAAEVGAFSATHRKSHVGPNESAAGDAANNGGAPDTVRRVVTGWGNAFVEEGLGTDHKVNTRALKNRDNETGLLLAEVSTGEEERDKNTEGTNEKRVQVTDEEDGRTETEKEVEMKQVETGKEENVVGLVMKNGHEAKQSAVGEVRRAGVDTRSIKQDNDAEKEDDTVEVMETERRDRGVQTPQQTTTLGRPDGTNGGLNSHHGDKDANEPSKALSNRGLERPPAPRDITPSELELLLALWILLYCCLILPQMNL